MPIPDKLTWPAFPPQIKESPALRRYFTSTQEAMENYLRTLQTDIREMSFGDIGTLARFGTADEVYYDVDGNLHIHIGGVEVCWFDWSGNWHRAVNIDNATTDLTKTNTRQLAAFDKQTGTLDIFHAGAQVLQIASGEIIVDNAFALLTGQTLDAVISNSWISESVNSSGNLTTFLCAKEHRVLEIEGTDVKISGALKLV